MHSALRGNPAVSPGQPWEICEGNSRKGLHSLACGLYERREKGARLEIERLWREVKNWGGGSQRIGHTRKLPPDSKAQRIESISAYVSVTLRFTVWGWGNDSAAKSSCCSCRVPGFNSQSPQGGHNSNSRGSNALVWPPQAYIWFTDILQAHLYFLIKKEKGHHIM